MIKLSQRLEMMRTKKNISRVQLAQELGLPKLAVEKFETGRLTPTKEQQERIAQYFGVSPEFLRGESDDPTSMASWMELAPVDEEPAPVQKAPASKVIARSGDDKSGDSAMFALLLKSDTFKKAVLEILKTPEGKELIRKAAGK